MKLEIQRERLLKPLQQIVGVVERRQTLPILSNTLVSLEPHQLTLTATDTEVELATNVEITAETATKTTLPARKLFDIVKSLPEGSQITLSTEDGKAFLHCGRSRFSLATLPADDFPTVQDLSFETQVDVPQNKLKALIDQTHFAMAQQDVRYYLNGLLLELEANRLRAVTTDGHRLAYCELVIDTEIQGSQQVILPRKGVQELLRLLSDVETPATLEIGSNHLQVKMAEVCFISKLIDGKFPDYQRVIPQTCERIVRADRIVIRTALARTAILANEKYRGVRLIIEPWLLRIQAHNPDYQEEAEEEVEIHYDGNSFEIGFNVAYLLDALGALRGELVKLSFTDASGSCLLEDDEQEQRGEQEATCQYVIMPMRL